MTYLLILLGKLLSCISRLTNHGNGSTWPGHIALTLDPDFIEHLVRQSHLQVIFVVGTNGKTTTSRILATLLEKSGKTVLQNASGANLVNGIASALLLKTNTSGKITADYAIFEIDENALPQVLFHITPMAVIVLNLFRDQLDRYGELDTIIAKWKRSFSLLPQTTTLILNADDPQVAYLGDKAKTRITYIGMPATHKSNQLQHAADSIYCPRCQTKLIYTSFTYSHLGHWRCAHCSLERPEVSRVSTNTQFPLPGVYNAYNTFAAVAAARLTGLTDEQITAALSTVTPAFGRQEKLTVSGKQVQVFLAKNPTGFNQSLETVMTLGAKTILIVLNDRIPDGRDVSWIWDIDIEPVLPALQHIIVSGDRAYDMALRMTYAQNTPEVNSRLTIMPDVSDAIVTGLKSLRDEETLYILPTYSAMLAVRKILTGKKIL